MKWIDAEKELPQIPENKFGISVLAVEFDPVYEEINPGKGYTVMEKLFTKSMGWTDFYYGLNDNYKSDFCVCCHQVTHWMYLPDVPLYK